MKIKPNVFLLIMATVLGNVASLAVLGGTVDNLEGGNRGLYLALVGLASVISLGAMLIIKYADNDPES